MFHPASIEYPPTSSPPGNYAASGSDPSSPNDVSKSGVITPSSPEGQGIQGHWREVGRDIRLTLPGHEEEEGEGESENGWEATSSAKGQGNRVPSADVRRDRMGIGTEGAASEQGEVLIGSTRMSPGSRGNLFLNPRIIAKDWYTFPPPAATSPSGSQYPALGIGPESLTSSSHAMDSAQGSSQILITPDTDRTAYSPCFAGNHSSGAGLRSTSPSPLGKEVFATPISSAMAMSGEKGLDGKLDPPLHLEQGDDLELDEGALERMNAIERTSSLPENWLPSGSSNLESREQGTPQRAGRKLIGIRSNTRQRQRQKDRTDPVSDIKFDKFPTVGSNNGDNATAQKDRSRAASVLSRSSYLQAKLPKMEGIAKSLGKNLVGEVKLEEILKGETCSPISFKEFEKFVTYKEHTTENLLFCVWFRSYVDRFNDLPVAEKLKVPIPNKKLGERDDPYGYMNPDGEKSRWKWGKGKGKGKRKSSWAAKVRTVGQTEEMMSTTGMMDVIDWDQLERGKSRDTMRLDHGRMEMANMSPERGDRIAETSDEGSPNLNRNSSTKLAPSARAHFMCMDDIEDEGAGHDDDAGASDFDPAGEEADSGNGRKRNTLPVGIGRSQDVDSMRKAHSPSPVRNNLQRCSTHNPQCDEPLSVPGTPNMLQRSLTRIPSRLTIGRPASPSSRPKSNKHTSISSSIANLVPDGMRSAPYLPRFLTPQSTQSVWVPPVETKDQPMRKEAQRAFATFLRKGASQELNITDEMRRDCAVALRASSHPDVFVPVYQEIYGMLEQQSLPHFLSYAQTNINLPKQLFWYAVGIIDIGISVLILLLMVFLLPARPFAWRAVRLVSVIFASFGAMQTYSAWRGYCTQVAGRNALQVRPWELDDDREDDLDGARSSEGDGERDLGKGVARGSVWVNPWDALEGGDSVEASLDGHEQLVSSPPPVEAGDDRLDRASTGTTTKNGRSTSDLVAGKGEPPSMADISPWLTMDKSAGPPRDSQIASSVASDKKSAGDDTHIISVGSPCSAQAETFMAYPGQSCRRPSGDSVQQQRFSCYGAQTRFLHRLLEPPKFTKAERQKQRAVIHRPPIFGPEKVVEDERVLRMHKRIIRDILIVGGVWGLVWVAVCLAIPSPK